MTSSTESEARSDRAYEAWRAAVGAVLAKARRVDPAELGPEPERLLDTTTYDDIVIRPLYTERDELPEPPLPGQHPFTRGRTADRDPNLGWQVAANYDATGAELSAVNADLLAGLANGITTLWLTVDATTSWQELLAEVLLDLAPLVLSAGTDVAAVADRLYALIDSRPGLDPAGVDLCLGADPHTVSLQQDPDSAEGLGGEAVLVALATAAAARPGTIRALLADGTVFHDAGASDADEVGATLASGVDYLRTLLGAGLDAATALGQVDVRLAATADQFQTIAKFRASRRLWARVAEVLGAPDAGGVRHHAVTSSAMMAQRDPWVNMLRTTLAAFGAGVGGADTVTVQPFDAALPLGAPKVSSTFGARIARNSQLLLLEEAHLGKVRDPAGGSWYVEQLTHELAAAAWSWFQEIERAGGFQSAVDGGLLAGRFDDTRDRRDADIAHRRMALTGVNEFPNLAEDPLLVSERVVLAGLLPAARYAEPFEALRDRSDAHVAAHGIRPRVFLATLGPVAEHNVRATFAANLLAAGGIQAIAPGPLADAAAVVAAYAAGGAAVVLLCGTDKAYAAIGSEVIVALRSAGALHVAVAGPERAFTAAVEPPDAYLTAGIDAVAALTALLSKVGVA
jgi:methylmalonyl-CoA mutase